ncbi:MAG TPA: efflux RND transporter permease subunit [bacterium]|nr:efflux RND transporter permease subunit [bacterium]
MHRVVGVPDQSRRSDADRLAAVRGAARPRVRPIIMTTFAMIFGMLPMALGVDPGGGQRSRSASWWSAGC